ncbi:RNA polymerase sigma factor [Pseudomonadota bacterium]
MRDACENNKKANKISDKHMLTQMSDDALIGVIQKRGIGWKLACNLLLQRYRPWVFSFCLIRLRNPQDAQDVTQDVILRVYTALRRFEGRSSFKTWLHAVAENQVRTFIVRRARYVQVEHIEAMIESHLHVYSVQDEHEDSSDEVRLVLKRVSPQAREVLRLRFAFDCSLEEIAGTLGISLSAAKMRLYRALDQFKAHYILAEQEQALAA